MIHAAESIILDYVLEVTNDNQGQLLVNGFEVSDHGDNSLFKLSGVAVLLSSTGIGAVNVVTTLKGVYSDDCGVVGVVALEDEDM